MGLFGGKKQVNLVGLDIGSSSVKAVELKKTKDGFELLSVGLEPLSPETVVDGAIIDALSVSAAIDRIYAGQKVKNKNVATSVSGHSVIIKKINNYQSALIGRTLGLVDVDAFALQNTYETNYQPNPDETAALLNIGASVMNINIVRGGVPLFTRDVSVGGNQYTDALQKELELTFEDAENLKRGQALAGISDEQKAAVLRSVSEILVLEIQKTFDFFRATAGAAQIGHIYAAGGAARTPALLDMLREEFQMPVDELDPFRRVTYNPAKFSDEYVKEIAPRLAVCVGLGLRSFDEA